MSTIWIPILAIGGLILLSWLVKDKAAREEPDDLRCGMGCCGRGGLPPRRKEKSKSSPFAKCP
ncbi:MAG: hypothetical protein ACUVWV_14860 [Thermodesulfobacteriota bacterium]